MIKSQQYNFSLENSPLNNLLINILWLYKNVFNFLMILRVIRNFIIIYSVLIINTHGFLTNIGEILFYDICKIIDPEYIIFLYD